MPRGIKVKWTPLAVDALIDLEDYGQPETAQRIVTEVYDRLTRQPGIYREVQIRRSGTRRRSTVRRLYLGEKLPYLVYFFYDQAEGIVEVVRVLHVRRRPLEK